MKKLALLFLGLGLLAPAPLFADTVFDYSFGTVVVHGQPGLPYSGSGQFDTVATSTPGMSAIVGATGTVTSLPIGTNAITGFSAANSTLSSNNGTVFLNGIGLLFNGGELDLNAGDVPSIFLNTGYLAYLDYNIDPYLYGSEIASASLTITEETSAVAATPEPATFVLLGTGLVGTMAMVRRRIVA